MVKGSHRLLSTQHWQCGAASLYMRAILEQSGASIHPSLLSQKKKTTDFNKEIYDVGCQSNLESIKRIGVIPRRYGRHRGRQATYFSLAKPLEEHQKAGRDRNLPQIMPYHAFHKYYPSSAKKSVMLSAHNFFVC